MIVKASHSVSLSPRGRILPIRQSQILRIEEQSKLTDSIQEAQEALARQEEKNRQASHEMEHLQERMTQTKVQAAKWEQDFKQAVERLAQDLAPLGENKHPLERKRKDLQDLEESKARLAFEQGDWESHRRETGMQQQQAQGVLIALRKEREVLSKELMDQEGLARRVQEIKLRMELLGPVNQTAIEEYPKLQERYDFLSVQKQDLEEANENLLDTGVEIIAQPPGKKP